MNVLIHSLIAHIERPVRMVVFCEERQSYVFKLYADMPFGRFESPVMIMFDSSIIFCNDGKKFPAHNAENVLNIIYKRFRKIEEENVDV